MIEWFGAGSGPGTVPEFWREYLQGFDRTYALSTPLADLRFVVLDTETTGLDTNDDQILAIGAVVIQNWSIYVEESFECYVHQVYEPVRSVVELHGILPVDRESSLEEAEAIRRLLLFLKDSVLVGHHISFDVAMVNTALRNMGGKRLKNHTVDTLRLAQRLKPSTSLEREGAFALDQLCRRYGIPLSDRHTAAGDAFLTGLLFLKQLSRLQDRGVKTLGELLRKPLY